MTVDIAMEAPTLDAVYAAWASIEAWTGVRRAAREFSAACKSGVVFW